MSSTSRLVVVACLVMGAHRAFAQDVTPPPPQDAVAPPPQEAAPVTPPPQTFAPPVAAAQAGQQTNGFVLDVHLGTRLLALGGGLGGGGSFDVFDGGFFAGLKLDRLMLGLGLAFTRVHQGRMGVPDTSTTAVVVMPGVRYAFIRSADERVELFGQLDIGIGHTFTDPDGNNVVLRYIVGPGVRFWVHPQVAFAALTGLDGTFVWTNGPWTMNDNHAVFASLRLLGVF